HADSQDDRETEHRDATPERAPRAARCSKRRHCGNECRYERADADRLPARSITEPTKKCSHPVEHGAAMTDCVDVGQHVPVTHALRERGDVALVVGVQERRRGSREENVRTNERHDADEAGEPADHRDSEAAARNRQLWAITPLETSARLDTRARTV